jgi:hypothetical protein
MRCVIAGAGDLINFKIHPNSQAISAKHRPADFAAFTNYSNVSIILAVELQPYGSKNLDGYTVGL